MMPFVNHLINWEIFVLNMHKSVQPVEHEVFQHNTEQNVFKHGPRAWNGLRVTIKKLILPVEDPGI